MASFGRIDTLVNNASICVTKPLTQYTEADYIPAVLAALTKGVLNAATQSLAMEYAKRGIRVSAATPRALRRQCIPSRIMRSSPSCLRSAV